MASAHFILSTVLLPAIILQAVTSSALAHSPKFIPEGLTVVNEYASLSRSPSSKGSKSVEKRGYSTLLRPTLENVQYSIEVKFNGIPRYLTLDTGSSDTWMVEEDFECLSISGDPIPASDCLFGDPYTGQIHPIKNETFYLEYGRGKIVYGTFGYSDVEVASLSVKRQQVALVNKAYNAGDSVSSGLIGLARRGDTNAYPGGNFTGIPTTKRTRYPPIIETMFKKTPQIKPLFSLALQRGDEGGYIAFGGLPPVNFTHDFTTVDLSHSLVDGIDLSDYWYPIQPKGYTLDGKSFHTNYTAIVDSGTYALLLPKSIADNINAAFDPPGVYNDTLYLYTVACNATPPDLGLEIGGKTFQLQPADFFIPYNETLCISSIAPGLNGADFYILGDVFLHNVVAVFDLGKEQMHFAEHSVY